MSKTGAPTPIAVSIAGSDSGAGAGIQADLKTFSALGVYGATVVTALTAQNSGGIAAVFELPADFVTAQIDAVFSGFEIGAVKIGMLANAAIVEAVAAALARHRRTPIVLDPVIVASSGERLLRPDAIELLRSRLLPHALLLTPNLPEAAALLDAPVASSESQIIEQARRLLALTDGEAVCDAILMKGGHATGAQSVDMLVTASGVRRFVADRIATDNTHGTGCTLSAAITAGLAKGAELADAVAAAKAYVTAAIAAADRLAVSAEHGPLHHFHRYW